MINDGFHARDGLMFKRLDDGSVRIRCTDGQYENPAIHHEYELPAEAWASVVASVAARGETGQSWRDALCFHIADQERRICGVVSTSGPNGEPLACGHRHGHDGDHSWASLPTFVFRNDS